MYKHLLAFFLLITFINLSMAAQVTLIKHDNSEIDGELNKVTENAIYLKNPIVKGDKKSADRKKSSKTVKSAIYKKNEIRRIVYKEEKTTSHKTIKGDSKEKAAVLVKSEIPKAQLIKLANEIKKKHTSAGYVTLVDHETAEYVNAKVSTSIYHGAYIILKDDFKGLARISGWVNSTRSRFKVLFGRIIYPDGSEFYMNPDDMVKSAPPGMGAAFFSSGSSVLHYNFPNPSAGCIVEYKTYREEFLPYVDDFFSNRFTFNGDQPVLSTEFEIIMPEEKPLYWVSRNLSNKETKPSITTKNGKTTYLWSFGEQQPIIAEPSMPALGDITKRIYVSNQEKLEFLFVWNRKMLGNNMKVTPYIKERLKEILKNVSTDKEEILKYLYHWVQTKIRYVSIKSGSMSGMAGHPAEETLKNNFGDCVDKSVLFSTLLKAKGIEAYPISIKTNPGEEMESRIPCFNANHSITEVHLNGKKMILDTTATAYSYPNFRIDDHGVPVRNAFTEKVYRTPVPPPANNASNYTRTMELSPAGSIKVFFNGDYTGPRSAGLRGYYKTVPEKDLRKVFQRLASQDSPDAKLIDCNIKNIYDLNKDINLTYSYTSKEFLKKAGSLYILKNNSVLPYSFSEVSLDKRTYDIEYMSSVRRKNTDTYTLANNWKIEFLPKAIEVKNEYIHYKAQWIQVAQNKIRFINQFDRLKRIVPVKDYGIYKSDVQKILNFESENVLLKKDKARNYADLLILRDGIELDGELISSSSDKVVFESKKDKLQKVYKPADILSVEIATVTGAVHQTIDEVMDAPLAEALAINTDIDKYKGDLKVVLLDSHKLRLNDDGTYTWTSRIITKILKEKGKAAGFDNWTYDPQCEKFTIDFGRTINGTKVTNVSSRTMQSKSTISAYPEYKRMRNRKFALPDIKVGSVIDYQVTRIIKTDPIHHIFSLPIERGSAGDSHTLDAGSNDSWNSGPNSFYAAVPVISKVVTIDVPASFKAHEKILNNDDGTINASKVEIGDRQVFIYKNLKPMGARPAEVSKPEISYYQPLILFAEQQSWNGIFKQIKHNFEPTKADMRAAKQCVKRLKKKGKKSLEDIYEFVALEITHAGIGIRDYSPIPNRVKQIIDNKRGSSLDCAWLLTCLLRAFGAEATIGFAPTGWFARKHLKYFATLAWMSKPLVYCKYRHKTYVINPTTSTKRMIDSATIWEGMELLLIAKDGIKFFELADSRRNLVKRTLKGRLDKNGKLKIDSYVIKPTGYNQSSYRNLRSVLKQKWPLIAQQSMTNGIHPNAVVNDFSYENVDELKKDVRIEYKVEIAGYGKIAGDFILFKLPGVSYGLSSAAATDKRETSDIDLDFNESKKRNFEISLPKGYSIYYLPKSVKIDTGAVSYNAKVVVKDHVLKFTEEMKIKAPHFPKELYSEYQRFSKAMADFSEEYIILKKR